MATTLSSQETKPSFFPHENDVYYAEAGFDSSVFQQRGKLPEGFPRTLKSPLVWKAAEILQDQDQWLIQLSESDIDAITNAVEHFFTLRIPLSSLSTKNFPLPKDLEERLSDVSEKCHSGRGFCILRGMDPTKFTEPQNIAIQAGVSLYVASQRGFQDQARVRVLSHVADASRFLGGKPNTHGPGYTTVALPFHNDLGDMLGFYAINTGSGHGRPRVASAWQIYNDLAENQPGVLDVMSQAWLHDSFSDEKSTYPPYSRPLIHHKDGKVFFVFSRRPFTGFNLTQRNARLPEPAPVLIYAMDEVHYAAEKECITLPIQAGDLYYLNNFSIVHGREGFETKEEDIGNPKEGRHILKIAIRDPVRAWKTPETLEKIQDWLFGTNNPGGERREVWEVLDQQHAIVHKWLTNG